VININFDDLYQEDLLHEMIIGYYHLISIQMKFVIKNHRELKQVHKHLIGDENHLHLLLNPNYGFFILN
jgi:hypothetical protein